MSNAAWSYDAFISYSSNDSDWVGRFLRGVNTRVSSPLKFFQDSESLRYGDGWVTTLADAILRSRYFCLMASKSSVRSRWVEAEWTLAYRLERTERPGFLIPVLIEDCSLNPLLGGFQVLDCRQEQQLSTRVDDFIRLVTGADRVSQVSPLATAKEDSDTALVRFHRVVFSRPAFQRPFLEELSVEHLRQAIDDTILTLNTGRHNDRSGRLIGFSVGMHGYSARPLREAIKSIYNELLILQRKVQQLHRFLLSFDAPFYAGRDWVNLSFFRNPQHFDGGRYAGYLQNPRNATLVAKTITKSDEIDTVRNRILGTLNGMLQLVGDEPLPMIERSSVVMREYL